MQKSRIIGIDPASRDGDECAVCVAERDDEGNTNIIFAQRHLPTYKELGLVPTRIPRTRKKQNAQNSRTQNTCLLL